MRDRVSEKESEKQTERDRQTDRHIDKERQTERETDRQPERERERETDGQTEREGDCHQIGHGGVKSVSVPRVNFLSPLAGVWWRHHGISTNQRFSLLKVQNGLHFKIPKSR